jgi:predicted ribosomally synthesized peptide with nif11-like leader
MEGSMSAESAAAFIQRVEDDSDFAAELESLRENPDAVRAKVADAGFDATPDEIKSALLDRYGAELSQEQLDAIAAGTDTETIVAGAVGGTILVGVLAATAAAFW